MSKSANEYQVGGDHYSQAGVYQHWDFVDEFHLDYFVGVISKYITRWRKKGQPVQDLEKAIHYTVKLKELAENKDRANLARMVKMEDTLKFCSANRIENQDDINALYRIFTWKSPEDLDVVRTILEGLLEASPPRRTMRESQRKPSTEMQHPFGYDPDGEKK